MCHLAVRRNESFQLIWFSQVKDFARNFAPQVMQCSTNGSLYKTWICAAINLQECQLGGSLIPQVILRKSLSVLPGPFVPITLKCWFCSSKKSDSPPESNCCYFQRVDRNGCWKHFPVSLASLFCCFLWQSWGDGCSRVQASAVATSPGPVPARKELQQAAGLLLSST